MPLPTGGYTHPLATVAIVSALGVMLLIMIGILYYVGLTTLH
jgi:hypothetical protein